MWMTGWWGMWRRAISQLQSLKLTRFWKKDRQGQPAGSATIGATTGGCPSSAAPGMFGVSLGWLGYLWNAYTRIMGG